MEYNFIFNEKDFKVDYINLTEEEIKATNDLRFYIVYNLAFSNEYIKYSSTKFLRTIANYVIKTILNTPELEILRSNIELNVEQSDLTNFVKNKPYCLGNEFVNEKWVKNIIYELFSVFKNEIDNFDGSIDSYFTEKNQTLVIPSRVYFHLVESREDNNSFAFMATYSTRKDNKVKHYPLKYALIEYKDSENELKNLTKSLYVVAGESNFIKKLIETGEIFSPIYITIEEAYIFLKEVPLYEKNGIVCRIPNWWIQREENTSVKIDIDQRRRDGFGFFGRSNLVSVSPKMYYNGLPIQKEEIEKLLIQSEGLSFIKGKWVEVNKEKLFNLLNQYEELNKDGTTFAEVLRLYSSTKKVDNDVNIEFSEEDWLKNIAYKNLNSFPDLLEVSDNFHGVLRPYQYDGYKWLLGMTQYEFGVCLADDMGLGKTIQILAFLETYKKISSKKILLIVPASLIANWVSEINKFTPNMNYYVANKISSDINKIFSSFLVITTYQISQRLQALYENEWGIVILDEAQAIKNPSTLQAKKIKSLKRDMAIALTGTPIENNLLNLWSIYDFLNPGLLGTEKEFRQNYDIKSSSTDNVLKLSTIIKPFMLRRLKSDKNIINDLPDKNESTMVVELTKKQIVLYKEIVSEIENKKISEENQFDQKRIILTAILHLKQICNHPSQFTGDEEYDIKDSGKFMALKDLCEIIFEKREKVLIFTQFKEITRPINELLKGVFNKEGFIITGDTSINTRNEYVNKFQNEDIPYMILTLKTAGVGLNLTSATNVIHFDRWWNPAVENQATDRAYRIGQKNNLNVYKFTSKGTIEEIISTLLDVKTELTNSVLDNIDNNILNKLSSEELLKSIQYVGDDNE